ncbi:MAG: helix-turn-helix domain-containing protein [Sphingomonadales bacterium]|nr:helix-turn-helix domain-containing protein [Sphingomonadales bacterium]
MTAPVRSVTLAFSILRLFARERRSLSLSDVARATGTSPSSCLNLLRTLVGEGALIPDTGKRYALGEGWEALAVLVDADHLRLVARVKPMLAQFACAHDATVGLWQVSAHDRIELIALGESTSSTRIHMAVGQRQPIGGGAAGRALCAATGVSGAELARRFAQLRWQRPLTVTEYADQVAAARADGFSIDAGYGHIGICSLAAVVPDVPPRYVVTASTFLGSRQDNALADLGRALKVLAQQIA